jgi:hypothetical protein
MATIDPSTHPPRCFYPTKESWVHEFVAVEVLAITFRDLPCGDLLRVSYSRFVHAEPVPERVLENRFYTVKLVL